MTIDTIPVENTAMQPEETIDIATSEDMTLNLREQISEYLKFHTPESLLQVVAAAV